MATTTTVTGAAALLLLALIAVNVDVASSQAAGLKQGFYVGKCNKTNVESTVKTLAASMWASDKTLIAAFLRLLFHDAFVRGCDASILISGPSTEKTAAPNLSVRGLTQIDQVKTALEKACPGVVSCSDIIVMLTREFFSLSTGMTYQVSLGRRDGSISRASEALANLPAPTISISSALSVFSSKGLSKQDFVLLLSCHTVGITHCSVIKSYIWGSKINSTMNSTLVASLRKKCPQTTASDTTTVFLDQKTPNTVDNVFLKGLKTKLGVLPVDEQMYLSSLTGGTVNQFAGIANSAYLSSLISSLNNLAKVGVLTGNNGKIRTKCSVA